MSASAIEREEIVALMAANWQDPAGFHEALAQALDIEESEYAPEDVCVVCGIERTRDNVTAWCVERPENEDGPHEWVRP